MHLLATRFIADQKGAAAVEYGLVASLVSVVLLATLLILGVSLRDELEGIGPSISNAGR